MNRHVNMLTVAVVAGFLTGSATAFAADTHAAKTTPAAHPAKAQAAKAKGILARLQELTLTGIVAKNEIKVAGKSRTGYVLITSSGAKLRLPVAKAGKNAAATPSIKLADYIGQNVKLVAMGSEQKKGDKVVVRVKALKTIEKVALPAANPAPTKVA